MRQGHAEAQLGRKLLPHDLQKKYGIIDRYNGKIDFSHDRVWLYPKRRLSRGLYYKRRALNGIDAVFNTTSEGALSPLGYSLRPGRKTLVVYECNAEGSRRLFLVPNTSFASTRKIADCALLEKAYLRKSSY